MIKRTLYFSSPSYLSVSLNQLKVKNQRIEEVASIPFEDIGILILDNKQITMTHAVFQKCLEQKVALISCNETHMPSGLMLPIVGNTLQSKIQKHQIKASLALKKQLWKQTIVAKIINQRDVLIKLNKNSARLKVLSNRVNSGDTKNIEAQAAVYYWSTLFDDFRRDRYGDPPNYLLNFGYAILRSMVARALVSSGLLPSIGIFHKNQYNAFCLADDIMEPYRPFVDLLAYQHYMAHPSKLILDKEAKKELLILPVLDVIIKKKTSPLLVGLSQTTQSLSKCFAGEVRKIIYPKVPLE